MPRCPHCDEHDDIEAFTGHGVVGVDVEGVDDRLIEYLECPACEALLGSHHSDEATGATLGEY
jgi:Zn ribbon nucleic-acid-binding protein